MCDTTAEKINLCDELHPRADRLGLTDFKMFIIAPEHSVSAFTMYNTIVLQRACRLQYLQPYKSLKIRQHENIFNSH